MIGEYAIFLGCGVDVMHGQEIATPIQYQDGYSILLSV